MVVEGNKVGNYVKIVRKTTTICMLLLVATILVSCHAKEADQKARAYLRPLLPIGENVTDIIEKFGPPLYKSTTGDGKLSMSFFFDDHNKAALAAGVGGFTAFFTNNLLVSWEPIYETHAPDFHDPSIRHASVSFQSDKPVISFYLVSHEPKEGWTYVDNTNSPKLGYINKSPDLVIFSGQYTTYDSAPGSMHYIELDFTRADGEKLKALTSANVGSQLAMVVGSQVVTAPTIHSPITDGVAMLSFPDSSYSTLLQALQANK
jgi:hypothetical protein